MNKIFDFCILGAGIAGLSLADALIGRGLDVCIIEKNEIGSGASGTPGGLVNPATGRRATKTWKAEACYRAISANLEKAASFADEPFYNKNGVLRPAITQKMAGKMKERYKETTWKEGWCYWLTKEEIQAKHPGITCIDGGLWLPKGISVDVQKYLNALAGYLRQQGVKIITGQQPNPEPKGMHWILNLSGESIRAEHLVYATGYGTMSSKYWEDLDFHPIKGQVAKFKVSSSKLNFKHSVSSLGYISNLGNDNTFIQGSTYEHDFEDTEPSQFGKEYLRNRLRRTLPDLEEQSEIIEQWAGVRLSTPDRKPVLGRHTEYDNLHLFAGLGSKGLLYGKFLAQHYADHLIDGTHLFDEVDIKRFTTKKP